MERKKKRRTACARRMKGIEMEEERGRQCPLSRKGWFFKNLFGEPIPEKRQRLKQGKEKTENLTNRGNPLK